ncbi:ester cyclase [bacterium SCSIO 12643]|nr:ester cyclase [bacterium SCSIO 12643]
MYKTILLFIGSLALMAFTTKKNMKTRNQIAKSYYEILDQGNAEKMEDLLAPGLIDHDGHGGNAVEEIKQLTLALKQGFSNSKHELEVVELIGDDKVFVRWRMTAKHTGAFFGVPATNNMVNFVGHDLLKVEDGKVVEIWHVEDLAGMFDQLKGA